MLVKYFLLLEGYERILSKQKYVAGDVSLFYSDILTKAMGNLTYFIAFFEQEFTFADIAHIMLPAGLSIFCGLDLPTNAEKWPNVARWWADITSRPMFLETKKDWLE